jgi:hypothetical protein
MVNAQVNQSLAQENQFIFPHHKTVILSEAYFSGVESLP